MRVLLWLIAGPVLGLLVAWLLTRTLGPLIAVAAALGGQAAAYPVWRRLERRRAAAALRRFRGRPGVGIGRDRLTRGEAAAQHALWALGALLVAALTIVVTW